MKGSEEGGDVSRLSLTGWWIASFIIGTTSVLRVLPRGRIMVQPGLLSLTAHPTHDSCQKEREARWSFCCITVLLLIFSIRNSQNFLNKNTERKSYIYERRENYERIEKRTQLPQLSQALWPSLKSCWSLTCFSSRPVATTLDGRAHFRTHTFLKNKSVV